MRLAFTIIVCILLHIQGVGQGGRWRNQISKDGKIEVSSKVTYQKDENGDEVNLVEYKVVTMVDVSVASLVSIMSDATLHKEFLESTGESRVVKKYSDNEWLVYYYFKSPWPMPDTDCVIKLGRKSSREGKQVTFYGKSSPDLYEKNGVRRMELNDVAYSFRELEPGKTEIRMESRFIPVIMTPRGEINAWFPEGPAGIITRMVELAKKQG